jgi:hypothetical protein
MGYYVGLDAIRKATTLNSERTAQRKSQDPDWRDEPYKGGVTDNITLTEGCRRYDLDLPLEHALRHTIQVYKDGVSLVEGQDYMLNVSDNTILLLSGVRALDDELEIRAVIDTSESHKLENVLLLPRKQGNYEFDDEQLKALAPDTYDSLEVNRLLKFGNSNMIPWAGKRVNVIETEIRQHGLFATVILSKGDN